MIDYEYYYEQYRRVPRNSATTNRDLLDFQSTVTLSSYNTWLRSAKRPMTTTYIDGSRLSGLRECPSNTKGLFPKGKGRRKSSVSFGKRTVSVCSILSHAGRDVRLLQNTGDAFMSLVPSEKSMIEVSSGRSEKNRSPLSMTTGTQISTLPDLPRKTSEYHPGQRLLSSIVYNDESSDAKFYARSATTSANGGWVRRYKSMNESHNLSDYLRGQPSQEQDLLKKRSYPQLFLLSSSSSSSLASSWNKRQRAKC